METRIVRTSIADRNEWCGDGKYVRHQRYVDKYPVTNADFAAFIKTAKYAPRDEEHYLQHWENGAPPAGSAKKPVTYVALTDARAFCAHHGKRLPEVAEWQWFAGQNQVCLPLSLLSLSFFC